MRLRVFSIAAKAPDWIEQGWKTYAQRMPAHLSLELKVIPPAQRSKNQAIEKIQHLEADKLKQAANGCTWVALHERGQQLTTFQMAERMRDWQQQGRDVAFFIGGADGLHAGLLNQSEQLAMGKLTMPHHLVRVVLAEQLYRAYTVNIGHPYHRQ